MEGKDGKTERATPKRREKARQEGQMPISQEINTVVVLVLGVLAITWAVPRMGGRLKALFEYLLQYHVGETWTTELAMQLGKGLFVVVLMMVLPIMLPIMLGGILSSIVQTKPFFSTKTLKLKFSSLNPVNGLKNLFSAQSLVKFAMSMLKVSVVTLVLYLLLRGRAMQFISLQFMQTNLSGHFIFQTILLMIWAVAGLSIIIAVLDTIYQRRKHEKSIMMSKEEVKEERKNQEPNPQIKKHQMRKMRELTMLRMMAAIPDSTVVVTNPTHVAVALHYDPETMAAPKVVAKGLRLVAERIKRIARENGVPIIEKPPLARALYKEVKVGREVPAPFYGAIAELLAYLYRIGHARVRDKLTATKAA